MISDEELPAWLRLLLSPGVGRSTARRLLAGFGSAQALFSASAAALLRFVSPEQAKVLADPPDGFETRLSETRAWLAAASDTSPRGLVSLADAEYSQALLQTADPPLLLFVQGQIALLNTPSVAIVGSRRPTPQGLENARAIAADLGRQGQTIVSGLALGIDGAAHEGALDAGAPSIAVVGTGLDRVYPARHRPLARRLAIDGLLVSEFPLGTPPLAVNFPQRNRIIAGISRGTLVVEAALKSGSLITARMAVEAGRDVFAVPGSVRSPQSAGCHALLKQGARLVESAQDVLEEFGMMTAAIANGIDTDSETASAAEDLNGNTLLDALGHDPVSLEALLARTGTSVEALGAALLELELSGKVARLPGQLFQRVGQA